MSHSTAIYVKIGDGLLFLSQVHHEFLHQLDHDQVTTGGFISFGSTKHEGITMGITMMVTPRKSCQLLLKGA